MEKRYSRPKAFSSSTSNILAVMDGDGCKRSRSEVDINRGFIPSDMKDPNKKKILDDLTQKIFLSSDEEKLKNKKQVSKGAPQRPKYFFEKHGSQFMKNNAPVTMHHQEEEHFRSHSKKRNPHQMYTDSSYYHPKHHPSVADQVKMAHQLSSSLFDDANKKSQGQEMFFKRVKTTDPQRNNQSPSRVPRSGAPNMKLVMNPEGKLHDWTELPKEDLNELSRIAASHFSQLQSCNQNRNGGSNYSSYKDIFESRRNVFSNIMDNDPNNNTPWNRNMNAKNNNFINKNNKSFIRSDNYNPSEDSSMKAAPRSYYAPLQQFPQNPQNYDLLRSKTAPSIARPNLPKRGSSKHAVAAYDNRPTLEKFFV